MSKDLDHVVAAVRLVNALAPDSPERTLAEQLLVTAVDRVDTGALAADVGAIAADALQADPGDVGRWRSMYSELGSWGESVATSAAVDDGWFPVYQADKPGQTGLDLVLFNPDSEEIRVVEVKTTTRDQPGFSTSSTAHGKQGSDSWVDRNLSRAGMAPADSQDVSVYGSQINLRNKTLKVFRRDTADGRKWIEESAHKLPAAEPSSRPPSTPPSDAGGKPGATPGRSGEDARRARAEARKSEDARRTQAEARKAEDARRTQAEARKAEDARRTQAEARKAEDARRAEEARRAEDARRAHTDARQAEEAQQARRADDAARAATASVIPGDRRIPAGDRRFA